MSMHEMNKQIDDQVFAARGMLMRLESALRKCGYQRPGTYRSLHSEWSRGSRAPGVVIVWTGTTMHLFRKKRGYEPVLNSKGKPKFDRNAYDRVPVRRMDEYDLLAVAHHLEGFVDHLEESTRHMLQALVEATEKLQKFVERVEADPQPAA